jgi:hypothetical protein
MSDEPAPFLGEVREFRKTQLRNWHKDSDEIPWPGEEVETVTVERVWDGEKWERLTVPNAKQFQKHSGC